MITAGWKGVQLFLYLPATWQEEDLKFDRIWWYKIYNIYMEHDWSKSGSSFFMWLQRNKHQKTNNLCSMYGPFDWVGVKVESIGVKGKNRKKKNDLFLFFGIKLWSSYTKRDQVKPQILQQQILIPMISGCGWRRTRKGGGHKLESRIRRHDATGFLNIMEDHRAIWRLIVTWFWFHIHDQISWHEGSEVIHVW